MVFLFALLFLFILILSKIRIEINNLQFNSRKIECSHLNNDYKISIKLIILKAIPLIWINIDKRKIERIKQKQKINYNFQSFSKKISKQKIKSIIEKIRIKNLYLKMNIGTDFTIFTSILIPVFSTIISTEFAKRSTSPENQFFEIKPIYNSGNLINAILSTAIEINLLDIIKMYILSKSDTYYKCNM